MKTYVVIVSCYFPKNHQRTGEKQISLKNYNLALKTFQILVRSQKYNTERFR